MLIVLGFSTAFHRRRRTAHQVLPSRVLTTILKISSSLFRPMFHRVHDLSGQKIGDVLPSELTSAQVTLHILVPPITMKPHMGDELVTCFGVTQRQPLHVLGHRGGPRTRRTTHHRHQLLAVHLARSSMVIRHPAHSFVLTQGSTHIKVLVQQQCFLAQTQEPSSSVLACLRLPESRKAMMKLRETVIMMKRSACLEQKLRIMAV